MSDTEPELPKAQPSVHEMKFLGLLFGFLPFAAGLIDWLAVGVWHEAWQAGHLHLTPFQHPRSVLEPTLVAIGVTVGCLLLHAGLLFVRAVLGDVELGLSKNAWRVLFAGCEIAGLVIGGLLYFS